MTRNADQYDALVNAIVQINKPLGFAIRIAWQRNSTASNEIDGYPASTGLDGSGSHGSGTSDRVLGAVERRLEERQQRDLVNEFVVRTLNEDGPALVEIFDRMKAGLARIGINDAKPETPKCSHHAQFGIEAPVWADKTAAKLCRWCWTYKERNKRLPSPAEIDLHAQGRKVA